MCFLILGQHPDTILYHVLTRTFMIHGIDSIRMAGIMGGLHLIRQKHLDMI